MNIGRASKRFCLKEDKQFLLQEQNVGHHNATFVTLNHT